MQPKLYIVSLQRLYLYGSCNVWRCLPTTYPWSRLTVWQCLFAGNSAVCWIIRSALKFCRTFSLQTCLQSQPWQSHHWLSCIVTTSQYTVQVRDARQHQHAQILPVQRSQRPRRTATDGYGTETQLTTQWARLGIHFCLLRIRAIRALPFLHSHIWQASRMTPSLSYLDRLQGDTPGVHEKGANPKNGSSVEMQSFITTLPACW